MNRLGPGQLPGPGPGAIAHSWWPTTLTGLLTANYALAFFVFLGTAFLLLYGSIALVLQARQDDDLAEDIAQLSDRLAGGGVAALIDEMKRETLGEERANTFLQLFDADGTRIYTTALDRWPGLSLDETRIETLLAQPGEPHWQTLRLASQDADTRVVYASLSPGHVMVIGESSGDITDLLQLLAWSLVAIFLLAVPLAGVLVWLLARRAVAGIHDVSRAAAAFSSGNFDRRVHAQRQSREVQTLADSFDAMAARIQQLVRGMQEMIDNLAHDLRSPLGRIRLVSESALRTSASSSSPMSSIDEYRDAAMNTIAECDRLIGMIDTSLDVAETEAGISHAERQRIDMAALVEDACALFEPAAEERHLHIELSIGLSINDSLPIDRSADIHGEKGAIQRMVANLLDNAVKYTSEGGRIDVRLSAADGVCELSMRNSGDGIARADRERIFERFYRVEPSRGSHGYGLGLSYARAVARAHGGDILVNAEPGCYSEFVVRLPSSSNQLDISVGGFLTPPYTGTRQPGAG